MRRLIAAAVLVVLVASGCRWTILAAGTDLVTGEPVASWRESWSDDGRLLAFATAHALVPEDTDELSDIYVRDLSTGAVELAIVDVDGNHPDNVDAGGAPMLSGDGSTLLLFTSADLLLDGGGGGHYVRDLETGSLARLPDPGDAIDFHLTDDGRELAYTHRVQGTFQILDVTTGDLEVFEPPIQGRFGFAGPTLSGNGRFIVFRTGQKLQPDDLNGDPDLYRYDRELGVYERVTYDLLGGELHLSNGRPRERVMMTPDGRYVFYEATADLSVPGGSYTPDAISLYRYDTVTDTTVHVHTSIFPGSLPTSTSVSNDGRYVVVLDRRWPDAWYNAIYDVDEGRMLPVEPGGYPSLISGDGRFVLDPQHAHWDALPLVAHIARRENPTIAAMTPASVPVGVPTVVTFHGDGLDPDTEIHASHPSVTIDDVVRVSVHEVQATVTATTPGTYGAIAFSPGLMPDDRGIAGSAGACLCLVVSP